MIRFVKQFMCSRVAWVLGVVAWIWIAGEHWYKGLSSGFTGLNVTQVVIATSLGILFSGAFILNRGWERHRKSDHH